jgi:Ca2+-binding EF-hand superfamily protein
MAGYPRCSATLTATPGESFPRVNWVAVPEGLRARSVNHSGSISEVEFLIFVLVSSGKLVEAEAEELRAAFRRLDVDGQGALTLDTLAASLGASAASPSSSSPLPHHGQGMMVERTVSSVRGQIERRQAVSY